jgi:hypothetical protein
MNIMLYAPEPEGHPQVYCRVITDFLLKQQCRIVLAIAPSAQYGLEEWPDLKPFVRHELVQFVDCQLFSKLERSLLTAEELLNLQATYQIDATLFIEADKFRVEFERIASGTAPRLSGKNVGIFSRTSAWYPGEDFYTGAKLKWYAPTLRGTLGKIKRAILNRRESDKYFYENVIFMKKTLDVVLVKDERIIERFGPPVYWMPEIYKPFYNDETAEQIREFEEICCRYQEFLARNRDKEIILYFGRGTWYRGYDYFLKLLEMDDTSCGVHAGASYRIESGKDYIVDVEKIRKKLVKEGRLFETNCYIHSNRLIDHFFTSTSRVVSTHRLTGSSATSLHALSLGKPLLEPNTGLLGHRVRKHGLGMTYDYGDINDLYRQWQLFKQQPPEVYRSAIDSFIGQFDYDHTSTFFLQVLTGAQ